MQELKITISVTTDKLEQEVIDMLLDGKIDRAGTLNSLVLKSKSGQKSYLPEEL